MRVNKAISITKTLRIANVNSSWDIEARVPDGAGTALVAAGSPKGVGRAGRRIDRRTAL